MKLLKLPISFTLCFFIFITPFLLNANVLPELSLEEKARQSDLVLVGNISEMRPEMNSRNFQVNIDFVLKGDKLTTVEFDPSSEFIERRTSCCLTNRQYLFFLVKGKNGIYRALCGRNGVFLISK
jgi:hypothetical protein